MALQRLRNTSEPRLLWIDAICIDQHNIKDRNHQVARMRDIYAHALRVLIWLGMSDAEIDEAIDAFSHQGLASRLSRESFVELSHRSPETLINNVEKRYEIGGNDNVAQPGFEDALPMKKTLAEESTVSFTSRGLKNILRKPWWSRVWVVQEFIMARNPPLACIRERWVPWDVVLRILTFVITKRVVKNDSAFKDMAVSPLLNIRFICQD